MKDILEFIVANYIWFLGGTIIILLAIIGSYADKTNFGQGKESKESKKEEEDNNEIKQDEIEPVNTKVEDAASNIDENIDSNLAKEEPIIEEDKKADINEEPNPSLPVQNIETENSNQKEDVPKSLNEIPESLSEKENSENSEDSFNNFEKEFNQVIPEKDLVNTDILDEIEDLSFNPTDSSIKKSDSDLETLELPEIKNLKENDVEDVWKF